MQRRESMGRQEKDGSIARTPAYEIPRIHCCMTLTSRLCLACGARGGRIQAGSEPDPRLRVCACCEQGQTACEMSEILWCMAADSRMCKPTKMDHLSGYLIVKAVVGIYREHNWGIAAVMGECERCSVVNPTGPEAGV